MRQVLGQLTYSRVVSTLALFIALGGGAYAISIGKNDVKSRHIKNNEVKSADVKDDSLKGRDILEATLDTKAFTAAASTPFVGNGGDQPITCNSTGGLVPCGDVSLTTPVSGRILVLASGEMIPEAPVPAVPSGECRLFLDNKWIAAVPFRPRRERDFAISAVSAPVAAGAHKASLECFDSEPTGPGVRVEVYGITAILVGGS